MDTNETHSWLREEMRELRGDVSEIKTTLASQAASISHHIKRTDLLEARVEQVAKDAAAAIEPLEEWQAKLHGAWWLVGAVGVVAVAVAALRVWL